MTSTAAHTDGRVSTLRALSRLIPFAKPVLGRLTLGAVSALIASLLALSIPLVLEVIVRGPIASGDFAQIAWGSAAILVLGLLEAAHGLAAAVVRTGPGHEGRVRPAQGLLRAPSAAARRVPRQLAVRPAPEPHDAGHQHAAALAGVRRRAARRQRADHRGRNPAAVPLALAARHDFLVVLAPLWYAGYRFEKSYGPSRARARTRRATSPRPSKRASTASAC